MDSSTPDIDDVDRLLQAAATGDQSAWGDLLTRYRARLRTMVALRIDRRLQGRLDPSDVVQDAFLSASLQLAEYAKAPTIPFYLWLRLITGQKLTQLHRHHLGTKQRDAGREISLFAGAAPGASSAALAACLMGDDPRPSEVFARAERALRLEEALNRMEPLDREILAVRHFEGLSNGEAAQALGLGESAASKRYVRALVRLRQILKELPGGAEEAP